jgi:hypothetical protein
MLATDFIEKWRSSDLTERAAAQSHFRDLCDLLGEKAPTDADPKGESSAFEKGVTETTGGESWADAWRRAVSAGSTRARRGPEGDLRSATTLCARARKPEGIGDDQTRSIPPLTASPDAAAYDWPGDSEDAPARATLVIAKGP